MAGVTARRQPPEQKCQKTGDNLKCVHSDNKEARWRKTVRDSDQDWLLTEDKVALTLLTPMCSSKTRHFCVETLPGHQVGKYFDT